eukprot:PITA_29583
MSRPYNNVHVDVYEREKKKCSTKFLVTDITSSLLFAVIVLLTIEPSVCSRDGRLSDHTMVVKSACRQTRYPARCVSSMISYTGNQTATPRSLMYVAMRVSMERAWKAHDMAFSLRNKQMNSRERAAWRDCVKHFEATAEHINVCFSNNYEEKDIPTWLSAALTSLDTCISGFRDMNLSATNPIRALLASTALNLSELVSNSLSMYNLHTRSNKRRLLSTGDQAAYDSHYGRVEGDGFPEWVSVGDRRLLQSAAAQANVVVAQDGSGNYRTIGQAVKAAPQQSSTRYVIYIKAGVYQETVSIPTSMPNLMFIGDGKDLSVVTGSKNVVDGSTTYSSATVAVFGNGFIARDMSFENTAGPQKQQAVALLVGADQSVLYRCSMKGYQDTLYVYSLRQFHREVDIYGTVDFIFGNAAVVIQNSNIFPRRPITGQENTITAQGRTDPNQNTGISIHNCVISAAPDLQPVVGSVQTYLGRPWQAYSRTVFMLSNLGGLINSAGWLPWSGNFALSTLYYGEYMNTGVGAGTSQRVTWPGFHVITSSSVAAQFTVGQLISGSSWISATSVPFTLGIN